MGMYRLLTKSIVFSTRSRRRFFTFVIVFSILSGATILLLAAFDNFSREGMLDHRGVVVRVLPNTSVTLAQAQVDMGVTDGSTKSGTSAVIYYKYIDFGSNLRIFSIRKEYPWAFSAVNPTNLIAGRFPVKENEVLVSSEAVLEMGDNQGGVYAYIKPVVGMTFKLGISIASDFDVKVSGIVEVPASEDTGDRHWLIMPEDSFNRLTGPQNLALSESQIYVHSVSFIAKGDFISIISGETYSDVDQLGNDYSNLGGSYAPALFKYKSDKDGERNLLLMSLFFGLFGTFMVSTLYSYLITRFRRREVAVLKAMGYSKWDVRTVVLTEILVVAVTGFAIGLVGIQLSYYFAKQGAWFYLIMFSPTAILSFIAVVLSCVPGFIIITTRTLSVRPIELFRQK
ncbi:MAG: FtsX-like permease family protein [Candidatus Hodarchaeales archaeon]